MSRLVDELGKICRSHVLDEKWLLCPAISIGRQWQGALARTGTAVVNVRPFTFKRLALNIAGPALADSGLSMLQRHAAEFILDRLFNANFADREDGYLSRMSQSPGVARILLRAIEDLRRAGLGMRDFSLDLFEVPQKGRELLDLLQAYLDELEERNLIDYAGLLHLAIENLDKGLFTVAQDVMILLPEDMLLSRLEESLLDHLPKERRTILHVDGVKRATKKAKERTDLTDIELLCWLTHPEGAPKGISDGAVEIIQSVGAVNEVKSVLRTCFERNWRLDDVEVLHASKDTYVPLMYEIAHQVFLDNEQLPVTFAEGIPTTYSRPGRALEAWLAWRETGFSQRVLVRIIQDGLLFFPEEISQEFAFSTLAAIFRSVGVGFGLERYGPILSGVIDSLRERLPRRFFAKSDELEGLDDVDIIVDEDELDERNRQLSRRRRALIALREVITQLTSQMAKEEDDNYAILQSAKLFLEQMVRCHSSFDRTAREVFLKDIDALLLLLAEGDDGTFDGWRWLKELPSRVSVRPQGPRPGCLHFAPLHNGGHSGRRHTFIIGLDDSRFPGAGLQDPLLLDGERRAISPALSTAAKRLGERLDAFNNLLARLRGTVTLSFSCRNLEDNRSRFPSMVLVNIHRLLSGNPDADQSTLMEQLPPPTSFAPNEAMRSLTAAQWWIYRLCGYSVTNSDKLIKTYFPQLGDGLLAESKRDSDDFTSYDGALSTSRLGDGKLDPTARRGPVMSASRLETLARCPLAYMFQVVLKLFPPDEVAIDPSRWLEPSDFGTLLHEAFRQFFVALIKAAERPTVEKHSALLTSIINKLVSQYRKEIPPPSDAVFNNQFEQLHRIGRVFLREEEDFCLTSKPCYLEAAIGTEPEAEGTLLDTPFPSKVPLPSGRLLRARGRIDRIDRIGDEGAHLYAVWDYKMGSDYKYVKDPPFSQGRVIQHVLYRALAEERLKEVISPDAKVVIMGYFFPGPRTLGTRIAFNDDQLVGGGEILDDLATIAASGAYLATNNSDDCRFCDYRPICGDYEKVCAQAEAKLQKEQNTSLEPFRRLRGEDS